MGFSSLVWVVASNILGGSAFPAIGYGLRGFSAYGLAFWRTLVASLFVLPIVWRTARRKDLAASDWLRMAAVGLFGYAAPLLVEGWGQKLSSAANASLLVGVEPVSVAILSAIFLGEALNVLKVLSLISCLAGSALIVLQGIPFLNARITPHFKGDLLLFFHGFLWSLYSVIGKPVLRKVDPLSFTAVTTVFCAGFLALAIPAVGVAWPSASLPREAVVSVFYLAVAVNFLAAFAWNKALETAPASQVAHFIFLQPLVGVLGGVYLLGDPFTLWSGLGGGLILLGVYAAL